MYALYFVLEQAVFVFAAWTLGYHLCLALSWPAFAALICAPVIYAALCLSTRQDPKKALTSAKRCIPLVIGPVFIGLMMSGVTLFVFRFDADDVSFFHRALVQVDNLGAPFVLKNTQLNVPNLPPISIAHVMTSYEPLMAILGRLLVNDPLWFYQNVGAVLAAFFVPIVYVLLFRRFRLSPQHALWATAVAMVFLLLDGGVSRSFGNFAFVRLWQGKTILVTLFAPLLVLLGLRCLARPSRRRFLVVFLACVCTIGLSGSSLFLVPILLFTVSAAYCLSFGFRPRRLWKVIVLGMASAYILAIVAALVLGILPRPENTQVWEIWWPAVWWRNILLVLANVRTVVRSALALFLVPAVLLGPPFRRYLILFSVTLMVVFANPILGPSVLRAVTPAAYWRLTYLFPLPLCLGLVVMGFTLRRLSTVSLARVIVAGATVLAVVWSFNGSVFDRALFKKPSAYKLPPNELEFCRSVGGYIARGACVLAPTDLAWVLGLIRPDVTFETCRAIETEHAFRCAGKPLEGKLRVTAQKVLTDGPRSSKDEYAFLRCLEHNINYIVVRDRCLDAVLELLKVKGVTPSVLAGAVGYTLLAIPAPGA